MRVIKVTEPDMPPLDEFVESLKEIWESRQLTNDGKFHQQLEAELARYLGVEHISLMANGTLALMLALQALRVSGEVITTPFSFVATTHSLYWNDIKPVFCDIEPRTYTLDPERIEAAITPRTTAIMPVHVYGNPCDDHAIRSIADKYGLKIIYDAAHTFGVRVNGASLAGQGDLAALSFHATKVYTTFEGGAIVSHDHATKTRINYLRNFGFADEVTVVGPGMNAKMNEIQAAFGVLTLKHVEEAISLREKISLTYRRVLAGTPGLTLTETPPGVKSNHGYVPLLIDAAEYGMSRDQVYDELVRRNVKVRRYFYPLISHFPVYRGMSSAAPENLPVATRVATQVMCLPIYPRLDPGDAEKIALALRDKKWDRLQ